MKACYRKNGSWIEGTSLFEALYLEKRMEKGVPFVISLSGAGGKTSTIRRLAWEGRARGLRTLVLTTTHMQLPKRFGVIDRPAGEAAEMIEKNGIAVVGRDAGSGKIAFSGWEYYKEVCRLADLVLVEADGSKRLPLKAPRAGEPVIPDNTSLSLVLFGLSSLGKKNGEVCFRREEIEKLVENIDWDETVKTSLLETLMKKAYLSPLRASCPDIPAIPVFHQADGAAEEQAGKEMLEQMGEQEGIVTGLFGVEPSFAWF
jgi:xanthine dehydrogenase accessory factor